MSAPTVRRRRLGAKLRSFRDAHGWTLEDVAARTNGVFTPSKLSRVEAARTAARAADVEILLDLYGIEDTDLRTALLTLTREGARRGWWHSYRGVLSPLYEDLISLEAEASSIRLFQLGVIPGLLQTAGYAREVNAATSMTEATTDRIDAAVEVRLARQSIMTRESPPEVWAIIHEAALRTRCARPETMREQLQRLASLAELPNVSVQVLRADAAPHPGMLGGFNHLSFSGHAGLDVVYEESLTTVRYIEDSEHVSVYGAAFERLRAAALPFDESLAFFQERSKERESA
ncbi:helix-turn-helix domain-containing protein [Streptomyces chumphonensis]|uniref:helix-turn-helix domain-containing protein n=1 Tax=Streptomyces chumphonensis TaxID=1214925 RepID=UPI003D71D58F